LAALRAAGGVAFDVVVRGIAGRAEHGQQDEDGTPVEGEPMKPLQVAGHLAPKKSSR
jgi:hypothetical protein